MRNVRIPAKPITDSGKPFTDSGQADHQRDDAGVVYFAAFLAAVKLTGQKYALAAASDGSRA